MDAPFRIKICGVTSAADAALVAAAGADALGLNFFPGSPRYVTPDTATRIVAALPAAVRTVGVFVNAAVDAIVQAAATVRLDLIQLHGDEPPEVLVQLGPRPLIRAFRCGPGGAGPIRDYLDHCRQLGRLPDVVLIDAYRPGSYGGTGLTADWPAVCELAATGGDLPIVLAGGLTPDNVAQAIAAARPAAVDVASGVEAAPGRKDPHLVRAFVQQAREAFGQLRRRPAS